MNFSTDFLWQPNWKILLFAGIFLPITLGLGLWQLDRAEQKEEILADQLQQQQLPPIRNADWQQLSSNHLRSVQLNLEFETDRYLLLANRVRNGQVGYEVIGVAELAGQTNQQLVLVNRGWVPASMNRAELPVVEKVIGSIVVEGYYYCTQPNSMIRQSTEFQGTWPALVFDLDQTAVDQIFAATERPLPCEIRVAPESPVAFVAGWEIVNQSVAKHIGYAVQWFLMAFALIILALFSNSNLGVFFRSAKSADK